MKPFISIIIPIYNAEHNIEDTVQTIIKQSYKNFELILVNDGSTDNSLSICKKLQNQHPSIIKIVNKENKGVLLARKDGVNESKGEWIMFVDADDKISYNTLELLVPYTNTYDLICFDALYTYKGKVIRRNNNVLLGSNKLDIHRSLLNFKLSGSSWGKLYRKELFDNNFQWPNSSIKIGEDILTTIKIIERSKKIKILNKELYYYEQNNQSVMHSKSQTALLSMQEYIKSIKKYYANSEFNNIRNDINKFIIMEYYAYMRYGGEWDPTLIHKIYTEKKLPINVKILLKAYSINNLIGKYINSTLNILSYIKNKKK